jgi:hypothetical protein
MELRFAGLIFCVSTRPRHRCILVHKCGDEGWGLHVKGSMSHQVSPTNKSWRKDSESHERGKEDRYSRSDRACRCVHHSCGARFQRGADITEHVGTDRHILRRRIRQSTRRRTFTTEREYQGWEILLVYDGLPQTSECWSNSLPRCPASM